MPQWLQDRPMMSVKYCLLVPVFHFWPKLMQRGISRSRSFKVTDVGSNRKPICVFLTFYLVPFRSHRILLFRFWTKKATFRFWAPLRHLGATYAVHLKLIGKFIFVLIKHFRTFAHAKNVLHRCSAVKSDDMKLQSTFTNALLSCSL